MTNTKLIDLYKRLLTAEEKSEGTIKDYVKYVEEFLTFIGDKELDKVNKLDIKLFINDNPNLSKNYKNLRLCAIKSFFNFLVNDIEYLNSNPTIGIKSLTIKTGDVKEKTPLTKNQVEWLLDSSKNYRDKAIIETLLKLGLRISELINITLDDYNNAKINQGELIILGKGAKERSVFITESLFEVIDKYLLTRKESSYNNLFISNGCKPMDRTSVSRTLKTIAKRSGKFTDEEISNLCNHVMRHSFVTNAVEAGVPIEAVADAVGHSSVETTYKVYLHQSKDRIKNVFDKIEF